MQDLRVAVVGATGLVGRTALNILEGMEQYQFKVIPYATERSASIVIPWRSQQLTIELLNDTPSSPVDYALFCAPNPVAEQYVPLWRKSGVRIIDNSSAFRMADGIPLVVPEVNANRIADADTLVANPNCSTIQLAAAIAPLDRAFGVKSVSVATYQAVSGAGQDAVDDWRREVEGNELKKSVFPRKIHGNVIPMIGAVDPSGYCREETKMMEELPKILEKPSLHVSVTTVRVPVETGHSEAVDLVLESEVSREEVTHALQSGKGLKLFDSIDDYPTPFEIAGTDEVYVGRVRQHPTLKNVFQLWIVADNVRKGAATNAIQIMEEWMTL